MKRGFLNSNNPRKLIVTPAKDKEITARPTTTTYVFPDIPPEYSMYPCSPEIALKQMFKAQMRCMSIPLPSPYTNELSSLCVAPSETRTALFAMDDFPAPLETPFYTTYTISDVPGAGKGMFATKDLASGDLILRERPVVVIPEIIPTVNGDASHASQFITLAVQNVPPKKKEAFLQLHDCKNFPDKVKGIIDTNAMNVGRLPGPFEGSFAGVALGLSRINHRFVLGLPSLPSFDHLIFAQLYSQRYLRLAHAFIHLQHHRLQTDQGWRTDLHFLPDAKRNPQAPRGAYQDPAGQIRVYLQVLIV